MAKEIHEIHLGGILLYRWPGLHIVIAPEKSCSFVHNIKPPKKEKKIPDRISASHAA
jgi:hypothetical protein